MCGESISIFCNTNPNKNIWIFERTQNYLFRMCTACNRPQITTSMLHVRTSNTCKLACKRSHLFLGIQLNFYLGEQKNVEFPYIKIPHTDL